MSNPILQSNQSSAVVATINESETMSPWVYNETNRLVVPHAMQVLSISKSSGTVAASKTFSYDIAKNGLVQGLWLNMTMPTVATPATETEPTGASEAADGSLNLTLSASNAGGFTALGLLGMIQEVRLTTSGRIVESLDKYQILARIADLPYGQRQCVQQAYRMGGDPERNTTYQACLWLPFFFAQDPSRYHINSNFQEPFRVEVSLTNCEIGYNLTASGANATTLTAHAPTDCELLVHYRQLDEKALNDVVNKNYSDGLLSQIVHISKTEAVQSVAAGTLSADIELKENEAIQALYVIVEQPTVPTRKQTSDSAISSTYNNAIKTGAPLEVSNFELRFNNTTVMNVPGEFVRYFGRWGMHGQCGDGADTQQSSSLMRHVYKIDFSLDYAKGAFSNCVALREISNPKLSITFKQASQGQATGFTAEAAAHNVHVIYDTCTFLSTSSATGRVQLSISS